MNSSFDAMEVVISPEEDNTINNSDYASPEEIRYEAFLKNNENKQSNDKTNDQNGENDLQNLELGKILLNNTTIDSLKKSINQLLWLKPEDSITDAMKALAARKVTYAPVFESSSNKFIGFLDTLDLSVFVVKAFAENQKLHPHLYDPKEIHNSFARPVKEIINASKHDPFLPYPYNTPVIKIVREVMQNSVHRVPVSNENGQVIGLLSELDVISFLFTNIRFFPTIGKKGLEEAGLAFGTVISITNDAVLMKAFTTILEHEITGLAVIDFRTGALIDHLSASDLRGIDEQSFYKLEAPYHQVFSVSTNKKLPVVTCTVNSTLEEVLALMVNNRVKRVYVIDAEQRPLNVISTTDVFKLFALL